MPNIHPLLVHFPIALLTVAIGFEITTLVRENERLSTASWLLMALGYIGLLTSIATGLLAKGSVPIPISAETPLSSHEQAAFGVAILFGVHIVLKIRAKTKMREHRIYFILLLLGCLALLWLTAWFGGDLVYVHGVGVGLP